jgi:hypothetical protein
MGEGFRRDKLYVIAIFTATLNIRLGANIPLLSSGCMKGALRPFGGLWPNSSQFGRLGIYTVPAVLHAFSEETDANSHLLGIHTKQVALDDPIAHDKI